MCVTIFLLFFTVFDWSLYNAQYVLVWLLIVIESHSALTLNTLLVQGRMALFQGPLDWPMPEWTLWYQGRNGGGAHDIEIQRGILRLWDKRWRRSVNRGVSCRRPQRMNITAWFRVYIHHHGLLRSLQQRRVTLKHPVYAVWPSAHGNKYAHQPHWIKGVSWSAHRPTTILRIHTHRFHYRQNSNCRLPLPIYTVFFRLSFPLWALRVSHDIFQSGIVKKIHGLSGVSGYDNDFITFGANAENSDLLHQNRRYFQVHQRIGYLCDMSSEMFHIWRPNMIGQIGNSPSFWLQWVTVSRRVHSNRNVRLLQTFSIRQYFHIPCISEDVVCFWNSFSIDLRRQPLSFEPPKIVSRTQNCWFLFRDQPQCILIR